MTASAPTNNAIIGWYDDNFSAKLSDAYLHSLIDHIKSVGYGGVVFDFTVNITDDGSMPVVNSNTRMYALAQYAKSQGLSVSLQPFFAQNGSQTPLSGWMPSTNFKVENFFRDAPGVFNTLSNAAAANGFSTLYLGYENDFLFSDKYFSQWSSIVSNIRTKFSGDISYTGWAGAWIVSHDDFSKIGIWSLVDKISLEFQIPVSATPIYDIAQIQAAYTSAPTAQIPAIEAQVGNNGFGAYASNMVAAITALSQKYGKPITVDSVRFINSDTALNGGFDPTRAQTQANPLPLDPKLQTMAYAAELSVLANQLKDVVTTVNIGIYEPWMYFVWSNPSSPSQAADWTFFNAWKYFASLAGPLTGQGLVTNDAGSQAEELVSAYLANPTTFNPYAAKIVGGPGDDRLYHVAPGGNTIDGGGGINTALYAGAYRTYQISGKTDGSWKIADLSTTAPDQPDTLVNIQKLEFSDRTVLVSDLSAALTTIKGWYGAILREDAVGGPHFLSASALMQSMAVGQLTNSSGVAEVIKTAASSSSVATLAYQFFTGSTPSAGGMDYLVSPTGPNPNNLNSAYYQSFSLENRYINFAVNLGKAGAGQAAFQSAYGSLSLSEAMSKAYTTIFGSTPSAGKLDILLNGLVPDGLGGTETRAQYFAFYGQDGVNGLGTKAAMVGWLLGEAVKADIGDYALSNDAFLTAIANGTTTYGVDLIGQFDKPSYHYISG